MAITINGSGTVSGLTENIGIGIASPLDILHLNDSDDDCVINLDTEQANKNSIVKFSDPDAQGRGMIQYNHNTDSLRTTVAGTERTRIHSDGVLTVPAGIALGVAATSNASSNTLDDYEEGTWTPQVKIDGSTTGITHDAQGGTYTKIGNTVILHAVLSLSSKGSETGAVTFANFPFTVENWTATSSLDGGSICFGFYSGTTGISRLGGIAVGGTSTANLYRQASDQSQLNDTMWETKIVNGFSTRWTLIYQTSA